MIEERYLAIGILMAIIGSVLTILFVSLVAIYPVFLYPTLAALIFTMLGAFIMFIPFIKDVPKSLKRIFLVAIGREKEILY